MKLPNIASVAKEDFFLPLTFFILSERNTCYYFMHAEKWNCIAFPESGDSDWLEATTTTMKYTRSPYSIITQYHLWSLHPWGELCWNNRLHLFGWHNSIFGLYIDKMSLELIYFTFRTNIDIDSRFEVSNIRGNILQSDKYSIFTVFARGYYYAIAFWTILCVEWAIPTANALM